MPCFAKSAAGLVETHLRRQLGDRAVELAVRRIERERALPIASKPAWSCGRYLIAAGDGERALRTSDSTRSARSMSRCAPA